jgi:hypothetical protein
VTKYRHLAEDALGVQAEGLSLLCVLLLRGVQTPGELKARTERMAAFDSLEQVEAGLGALIDRGYARRLERRPGQKEDRFEQLLGGGGDEAEAPSAPALGSSRSADPSGGDLEARVAALEAAVAQLRQQLL